MPTESIARVLPRTLFPYAQQWAERSGLTLLSRLLADDHLLALIEKYGDELVTRVGQSRDAPRNGSGRRNGNNRASRVQPSTDHVDADPSDLGSLQARVLAMETQQEAQQAQFEILRSKIRPLALALGCCPECLVGVDGCSTCSGQSKIGHFEPDYTLLATQVVTPLAARGVPLVLNERPGAQDRSNEPTATRKRNKRWPKK